MVVMATIVDLDRSSLSLEVVINLKRLITPASLSRFPLVQGEDEKLFAN